MTGPATSTNGEGRDRAEAGPPAVATRAVPRDPARARAAGLPAATRRDGEARADRARAAAGGAERPRSAGLNPAPLAGRLAAKAPAVSPVAAGPRPARADRPEAARVVPVPARNDR